jgi:hypothetical protein
MKEKARKLLGYIGGKDFLILLIISFAGYVFLERIGVFRITPASYRQIFHATPSKIVSILCMLNALTGFFLACREKNTMQRAGTLCFFSSILILAIGLWISIFTRFEGSIVRSPAQTFGAFRSEYDAQSLYTTQYAELPQIGILLKKLHLNPSDDRNQMLSVTADISYTGRTTGKKILGGQIGSRWPLISDWTFVRITDFGYAPRYVLYDLNEKELESQYVYMKLFPPDEEDNFKILFLGYVFYLRIYPDYADNDGNPETVSLYPHNPAFNLRIIRNKDIVFNGLLKPGEKVRFDNVIISFPEVQLWVEISLVRDLGIPVVCLGISLLIVGVVLLLRKK